MRLADVCTTTNGVVTAINTYDLDDPKGRAGYLAACRRPPAGLGDICSGPTPWIVVGCFVGAIFGVFAVGGKNPLSRNKGSRSTRFRRWGSRKG